MKLKTTIFTLICLFISSLVGSNAQSVTFEKSKAFLPQFQQSDTKKIIWGYLKVPETWDSNDGKTIKIAVTILKKISNVKKSNAIVFIQGGPGASGVENIWTWLEHPLRENNDIILFDARGTGFSQPRLSQDLGKKFLEILAKNQTEEDDEKQKTDAVMLCKQDLVNRGINVDSYNSFSVSKDLHALLNELKYKNWTVYGVSYGTYVAQVYANNYPNDIKSLILDSVIDDISNYYVQSTSNYMSSLKKVFELCKKTKKYDEEFPDLEKKYYEVIADLNKNPLTVLVDKSIVSSGRFTYNVEDFKIAIQQALYNKQLVEVLPLLINQFHVRNNESLGNLIGAFSNLLQMDYGVYYCVSCNEAIPNNAFSKYEENAIQFKKLNGGISFYKSDFKVCEAWNVVKKPMNNYKLLNLSSAKYPVLIFSGEFDPITPLSNGDRLSEKFSNVYNVKAYTYGHVPSFTKIGQDLTKKFIDYPGEELNENAFEQAKKIEIARGIIINKGVSKAGNSFVELNPIFMFPLIIALSIMLFFILKYFINFLKKEFKTREEKNVHLFSTLTSIIGLVFFGCLLLAIINVSQNNFFILAFGLPVDFKYIFLLMFVFFICQFLNFLYFIVVFKKLKDRSVIFSLIFSNLLISIYLFYWGVI